MRHRTFIAALLALAGSLAFAAPAQAVTIGFEGVAPVGSFVLPAAPYSEAGFALTNSLGPASATDGIFDVGAGVVNNGTDVFGWCGGCDPVLPLVITLTESGGGPFSLVSFEAANLVAGLFTAGEEIVVTGNLAGGGTVVQNVSLVQDTFTLFTLSPGFMNLTSVDFVGSLAPAGSHLAFDNLVVMPTPEPETALLLAGGLLGLASFGRRSARP